MARPPVAPPQPNAAFRDHPRFLEKSSHNQRYEPHFLKVKKIIESDVLGECEIDLATFIAALKGTGYNGPLTGDPMNPLLTALNDEPDGNAWTGFVSVGDDGRSGYALLFRKLNPAANYELRLPLRHESKCEVEVLWGDSVAEMENGKLKVEIPEKLRFLWLRFNPATSI